MASKEVLMDLKALGESLGLDEDEFIEIVEIFLESAASDIKRLEDAIIAQNSEALSEAAHSLKGSAGNLGFTEISKLSASLEDKARKSEITDLASSIPTLSSLLETIKAKI